jgi:UV excision repair protein RAD23
MAATGSFPLTTAQITQVKAKVQESQGWEPSTLKFIYSGKVLQDDKTVESYNIEEKGFIVCMTQKVGLGASLWKLCLTCL